MRGVAVGDDRSDGELLVASAREPEAFAVFYRRHLSAVLGYLLARVKRAELAADLCAEVFARALAEAERYEAARAPARAWLFSIAHSALVDSVRRGQVDDRARRRLRMPARELADEDLERVEELADLDASLVERAVAGLSLEQRQAVLARVVDERDYSDIARELEVSESVVRKRVSRGLGRLREQLRGAGT